MTSLFHIPEKEGKQLKHKTSNQNIGIAKTCFRLPSKCKLQHKQRSITKPKTASRISITIANSYLKLSSYFHLRPLKQKHGFSLIGILVSSAIGLIVIAGFTKMFAHMSSQMNQFEQKVERMNLITFLGNYMNHPGHCKKTLDQVSSQISAGTNTSLDKIMLEHGGTALDIVAEKNKLKTKYGLEGFVDFQLNCDETGGSDPCKKCTGTYPCPSVKWSLSLISQTYINDIPSMNRVVAMPIIVTHTGPNDSDFECNGSSISMSPTTCPSGQTWDPATNSCITAPACQGGQIFNSDLNKCVCPGKKTRVSAIMGTPPFTCRCPLGTEELHTKYKPLKDHCIPYRRCYTWGSHGWNNWPHYTWKYGKCICPAWVPLSSPTPFPTNTSYIVDPSHPPNMWCRLASYCSSNKAWNHDKHTCEEKCTNSRQLKDSTTNTCRCWGGATWNAPSNSCECSNRAKRWHSSYGCVYDTVGTLPPNLRNP